jgi:signal transduction histidine kinase
MHRGLRGYGPDHELKGMNRRYLTAALTAISIVVLGSYLAYTQYIVNQIRSEAAVHKGVVALVQEGLAQLDDDAPADRTMTELRLLLQQLGMPIVFIDDAGEPQYAANLPFAADLNSVEGRRRIQRFALRLSESSSDNVLVRPGVGEFYFGESPMLGWMRFVPYLQVAAGGLLILIAGFVARADLRSHREQLWSSMARELAHQMGTPLSSLAGWVEVLQLRAEAREAMASTDRIGRLMQADVERLERVSRRFELVGKRQPLELVDVADVVDELVSYFGPRLPHLGKGITLRARIGDELPPVLANQVLLVWAVENILKNAVDALAGRGGRITVLAKRDAAPALGSRNSGTVHVIIADNGPGIAPGVRNRIFEPGISTKTSGWGVGLSLSRRIVEEMHNGRINVADRPSGGTVFDVVLPAAKM